ncbi:dipeptidyl peptidase 2-like [Sycon ciliatum]|uniref:dipeptidyl peptidase 2-like n=1 Tax=Sycon ciliatum TaxID=27933 RepID=UPI0031F6936D
MQCQLGVRVLLSLLALLFLTGCSQSKILPYTEEWTESRIDHFNPIIRTPDKFAQRMLVNKQYFDEDAGPILLYTGNEGAIDQFWNNTGFVFELAELHKGYVIFIEHRYYGKSIPFGDAWTQNYNYQFLTVEQAIADYAVIISRLKTSLGNPKRKVIAFGGSYGGVLTAFMRFKYPNIVDGGLAASAPIYPMGGYDFYRAVTEDCERYNSQCPIRVRSGYTMLLDTVKTMSGLDKVTQLFHLCKPLTALSLPHFLLWARNAFTIMAMADYPYPASFLGSLPAYPINDACNTILGGDDALSGLANATVRFYDATATGSHTQCHDLDKEYITCADATGCGNMAQWDIQICLQVRLASGTNNKTDMFPPIEPWTDSVYEAYCAKKYGSGLAYNTDFYNINFWTDQIRGASNLIFSNGDLDPWRYGGVYGTDLPSTVYPIIVKGGAHHLDLRGSDKRDPATVTAARDVEKLIIADWLYLGN